MRWRAGPSLRGPADTMVISMTERVEAPRWLADHLLAKVVGPLAPLDLPEVTQLRRERLAAPRRV